MSASKATYYTYDFRGSRTGDYHDQGHQATHPSQHGRRTTYEIDYPPKAGPKNVPKRSDNVEFGKRNFQIGNTEARTGGSEYEKEYIAKKGHKAPRGLKNHDQGSQEATSVKHYQSSKRNFSTTHKENYKPNNAKIKAVPTRSDNVEFGKRNFQIGNTEARTGGSEYDTAYLANKGHSPARGLKNHDMGSQEATSVKHYQSSKRTFATTHKDSFKKNNVKGAVPTRSDNVEFGKKNFQIGNTEARTGGSEYDAQYLANKGATPARGLKNHDMGSQEATSVKHYQSSKRTFATTHKDSYKKNNVKGAVPTRSDNVEFGKKNFQIGNTEARTGGSTYDAAYVANKGHKPAQGLKNHDMGSQEATSVKHYQSSKRSFSTTHKENFKPSNAHVKSIPTRSDNVEFGKKNFQIGNTDARTGGSTYDAAYVANKGHKVTKGLSHHDTGSQEATSVMHYQSDERRFGTEHGSQYRSKKGKTTIPTRNQHADFGRTSAVIGNKAANTGNTEYDAKYKNRSADNKTRVSMKKYDSGSNEAPGHQRRLC